MLQPSFDIGADEAVDIAACRVLLKNGSKTFYAASFFLPRRVREPATALYAFCRLADDAVDMGGDAIQVLDDLKKHLTPAQIMELACVVGFWKFYNTVHDSLHIPVEEGLLEHTGYVDVATQKAYE